MVNDNIITTEMYHKVRGIIRGEFLNIGCRNCSINREDDSCYCDIDYQPSEEYVRKVARKICLSIVTMTLLLMLEGLLQR
jgi:hypothetical protein